MKSSKSSCISSCNSLQKSGKILRGWKDILAPVVSTLRWRAPSSPPPFRRLWFNILWSWMQRGSWVIVLTHFLLYLAMVANPKIWSLTFDLWPWYSIGFVRLSRYMITQNVVELSAAVHGWVTFSFMIFIRFLFFVFVLMNANDAETSCSRCCRRSAACCCRSRVSLWRVAPRRCVVVVVAVSSSSSLSLSLSAVVPVVAVSSLSRSLFAAARSRRRLVHIMSSWRPAASVPACK